MLDRISLMISSAGLIESKNNHHQNFGRRAPIGYGRLSVPLYEGLRPHQKQKLFWLEESRRPHTENNISSPLRGLQTFIIFL